MSLTSYYSRNQLRHLLHNQLRLKRNHVHHSPYVRNALINPCILLERVNTALRHQHATIEAISVVIKWLWLVLFVLHLLQYGFLILYLYDWLKGLIKYRSKTEAYYNIRFEQEAYMYDIVDDYLENRSKYEWRKFNV